MLPVLVLLIPISAIFFLYQITKLKYAEIIQDKACVNPQNVLKELQIANKSALFVSTQKLTIDLKNKFSCIEDVKIKKRFPVKTIIEIKVKKSVAKIEGTNFVVLESGQVEEAKNDKDKPTIYLPGDLTPQLGQKITDQNVLLALKIGALLLKSDFITANIRFLPQGDIAVYNNQGVAIIFSNQKGQDTQVDSLQRVQASSKIDATKIAKIDLRFDKPIIVYK